MRIGIDGRLWSEKGLGRYIRNLVVELSKMDSQDEFVLFCQTKDLKDVKLVCRDSWKIIVCDVMWYSLAEQLILPWVFYRADLDLLHVPHFNAPVMYFGRNVLTIHDLTHLHYRHPEASRYPKWLFYIKHMLFIQVLKVNIWKSKKIITISNYVQQDLESTLKIKADKVEVVYEAAEEGNSVANNEILRVLSDYNVTMRYFYYIGNAHPHKNLEFLLQAFEQLLEAEPNLQLVLSGDDKYFWPRLRKYAIYKHLSLHVVFTGKVTDLEKNAFMKGAIGYVFPSISEGFGLPMLEAMSCGCPVLAMNRSSLPEIGGEACLYFEPEIESLVSVMKQVLAENGSRKELIAKGYRQVQKFSWKKMAEKTAMVYRSALS